VDARLVLHSGTASARSLAAKESDFGLSVGALLAAYLHGSPLRNVFVQIDKPLCYLVAPANVSTPADLVGQAIGIGSAGDSAQITTAIGLRALGVDPGSVIYLTNVAGSPERAFDAYLRYLTADGTRDLTVLQRIGRNQRCVLQTAGVKACSKPPA
jgi:ABC-type nitrate/sulfonate/bicarbonate transport system substrate-binding protein